MTSNAAILPKALFFCRPASTDVGVHTIERSILIRQKVGGASYRGYVEKTNPRKSESPAVVGGRAFDVSGARSGEVSGASWWKCS